MGAGEFGGLGGRARLALRPEPESNVSVVTVSGQLVCFFFVEGTDVKGLGWVTDGSQETLVRGFSLEHGNGKVKHMYTSNRPQTDEQKGGLTDRETDRHQQTYKGTQTCREPLRINRVNGGPPFDKLSHDAHVPTSSGQMQWCLSIVNRVKMEERRK